MSYLTIQKNSQASMHIGPVLSGKRLTLMGRLICESLQKAKWEFDAIAFRGNSGAILSGLLASMLDKDLILIRKEDANSSRKVETIVPLNSKPRYIIVDDLISSGTTVSDIFNSTQEMFSDTSTIVGIVLYQSFFTDYTLFREGSSQHLNVPVLSHYFDKNSPLTKPTL